MAKQEKSIINIHWEGPFKWEEKDQRQKDFHCLYQIYGHHPLYGRNVLLYIGKTERDVSERLKEHKWTEEEYDRLTFYVGSLGTFESWEEWKRYENEDYEKVESSLVLGAEQLLILAHQPAYNTQNKETANAAKGMRIFNSGRFAQLFPELSYRYFVDDIK